MARADQAVALDAGAGDRSTRAELDVLDGDDRRAVRRHLLRRLSTFATFAHSLGELVGTGACLEALRRTRSGDFTLEQRITLDTLGSGGRQTP
jgi:tRNA U55 pseudouridine synthase TruB